MKYANYLAVEVPFIILGYFESTVRLLAESSFGRYLDSLFWIYIYGPLWDFVASSWLAIVGLWDSTPVVWVRDQITGILIWLTQVTATEWLTFLAIVLFWPIILIVYIVQSIVNLLKLNNPLLETMEDLVSQVMLLTSPEEDLRTEYTNY